jgi:membrane protease YdiL (CAAX protease family)
MAELLPFFVQLGLFLSLPFLWHVATIRTWRGFWHWIGIRRPHRQGVLLALGFLLLFASVTVLLELRLEPLRQLLRTPHSTTGRLRALGPSPSTWRALVLAAVFQTALTEELLFRGFIAKRLILRLGLHRGNLLQAAFFMGVHLPAIFAVTPELRTPALIAFIVLAPFSVALVAAWLNERHAGGSIVPGWILHGAGNLVGYTVALLWG